MKQTTSTNSDQIQSIMQNLRVGNLDTAGSIVKVHVFSIIIPDLDTDSGQPRAFVKILEGPAAGYLATLPAKNCPGHLKSERENFLKSLYGQTIEAEVSRLSVSQDEAKPLQIGLSLDGDWRRKREQIYKSLIPASGDEPGTLVVATVKEKHDSGVFCTFTHLEEEVGGFLHFTQMAFRDVTRKSMLAAYKPGDVIACEVLSKRREKSRPLFDVKLTLLASANRKRRAVLASKNIDPDALYTGRILSVNADHYQVVVEIGEQSLVGRLKVHPYLNESLQTGQSLNMSAHMISNDGTLFFSARGS